jgi:hypothetical protein
MESLILVMMENRHLLGYDLHTWDSGLDRLKWWVNLHHV